MLCGGRTRTDRAGAGTPAKLLEMWVTCAGGHVGDPKTNSSRGKSARSRYQQKKTPTLHMEQQTEPITLTAQTSCASQVELGWTECNLQQKIREFEKRQGEGEVFNKVFV